MLTARLLPNAARLYPGLDRATWYTVTRAEALGVFLLTGRAGHPERFVFKAHVEVRGLERDDSG